AAYAKAGVERHGRWFRFPYLDTGEESFDSLQALLGEFGFERPQEVGVHLWEADRPRLDWQTTLNTRDWALPEEDELRATLRQTRPGDLIEFHDKVETVGPYCGALLEELAALSLRATVPGRTGGGAG